MKNTRRTKRTKSTTSASLTTIDTEIANLADGIRDRMIGRGSKPANDTDLALDAMTDKTHLLKLAARLRLTMWGGCVAHEGTERERAYLEACTDSDQVTGIAARFQREIGHELSAVPIPIGANALHLAVTGALSEFDLAYLVRACFPMIHSRDVVHCAPRGGLDGTIHVFVLADSGWRPVGPPAWLREPAANETRVVAPPVTVLPEDLLAAHVRGGSL